jgi:ElaB/YqjD/DUF883 family membrane-anchored ribosome-binding protein
MTDAASDRIREAADSAQEMAGDIADRAREYGTQAQDAVTQFSQFVEKSLKEKPVTTLASVAVLGFVLGALWRK